MPQETISGIPDSLVAGDVAVFSYSPDDVSEIVETKFIFRDADSGDWFEIIGTVDPSDSTQYLYTVNGSDTAALTPGEYVGDLANTYDWGRETDRGCGTISLKSNPDRQHEKTFVERVIALLEQHVEGRLPEGLESYTIGGVPIVKIDLIEAEAMLTRFKARLRDEQAKRRVESGRASGRVILGKF